MRILPFNDRLCSEYYFFLSFFFQSQVLILLNVSLLEGDYEINTVTGGVNASASVVIPGVKYAPVVFYIEFLKKIYSTKKRY